MLKNFSTILILFFFIAESYPQANAVWAKRFVSDNMCTVNDMCVDKGGNVYLAGHTISPDSLLIIKYKTNGDVLWSRTYGGYYYQEYPRINIAINDSGNIFVMCPVKIFYYQGNGYRTGTGVFKYSSSGELLWGKRFIGASDTLETTPFGMIIDSRSNVYTIARAWGGLAQSSDWVTLKHSSGGELLWCRYYDNPGHTYDQPQFISKDKDDNIYVSGGVTVKYSPQGDSLWVRKDSVAHGQMMIDKDYNMYYGGGLALGSVIYIKTCKINPAGNLLWNSIYKNPSIYNNETFRDFCMDKNGNVYTVGASMATDKIRWDYVTIKYNLNGDSLWVRRYSPMMYSNDNPVSITVDKFNNIIVTGSVTEQLYEKYATVVYSPEGVQRYVFKYTNSQFSSTIPVKVLTDTLGNIYVTGSSQEFNGIATVKYGALTNVNELSSSVPEVTQLKQNYPNPFNPVTNINFNLAKAGFVSVKIYDELGRLVKELVSERKNAGSYSVTFDGTDFTSGVYYYKLETGDFNQTKRMILLK